MHKRLIGTWKSDKAKTLRTFAAYGRMTRGRRKQRLASIFGKLELRYTTRFCYVTFDGDTTRERYDVVAEDTDTIVLRTYHDQWLKKVDPVVLVGLDECLGPKIQHLHFESQDGEDYYWIGVRVFVEWFKKQGPTRRVSEPRSRGALFLSRLTRFI